MIIERINIYYGEDSAFLGNIKEIKGKAVLFCCIKMGFAWDKRFISFGEYDPVLNTSRTVNIYQCDPWPEGPAFNECEIDYCPFCGTEIQIKERDHGK